eukprot:scaffold13947_cov108-Isochrysis_galbana.AAC.7
MVWVGGRAKCRRVPCREARLRCGRGEVRGVFGVGRVGSVLLPGFCVVGRWIGHHCFTCGLSLLVPPHDNPPSYPFLGGRGGSNSLSTKTSTLPKQARGDEARKAQGGGGKRNLHLVFRGRWTIARGPSNTPFGGVRNLANTYRRCGCGANWVPPYNSYSHNSETHPGEGRSFETSARDERLEEVGGNEGGREWNIVTCWGETDDAVHNSSHTHEATHTAL